MHGNEVCHKKQLLCLMRNALNLQGEGIYDSNDCSSEQGDLYWEKAFDLLAMEAYGFTSSEKCLPS